MDWSKVDMCSEIVPSTRYGHCQVKKLKGSDLFTKFLRSAKHCIKMILLFN